MEEKKYIFSQLSSSMWSQEHRDCPVSNFSQVDKATQGFCCFSHVISISTLFTLGYLTKTAHKKARTFQKLGLVAIAKRNEREGEVICAWKRETV